MALCTAAAAALAKMSVSHQFLTMSRVYFAPLVNMGHNLLLEVADVLLELFEGGGQHSVLSFQVFDLVLQLGDLLQLLLPALGGGHPVARPLSLQLDHFLVAHVDRSKGAGSLAAFEPFATTLAFARLLGRQFLF